MLWLYHETIVSCQHMWTAKMKERKRKNRVDERRCPKIFVEEISLCASCSLFSSRTSTIVPRTIVPMNEVLEITQVFFKAPTKLHDAGSFLNLTPRTIMNWLHLWCDVCTGTVHNQPRYIGTSQSPVKVDKPFFSGRRKYHCSRLEKEEKSWNVITMRSMTTNLKNGVQIDSMMLPCSMKIYLNGCG